MRTLAKSVVDFLRAEDGPTAAEYAIMLALIVVVMISVSNIGSTTNDSYSDPRLKAVTAPQTGS